jgi:hypothetical protein
MRAVSRAKPANVVIDRPAEHKFDDGRPMPACFGASRYARAQWLDAEERTEPESIVPGTDGAARMDFQRDYPPL